VTFDSIWKGEVLWRKLFSDVDFLMVASLERFVAELQFNESTSLALLLLAKSLRLNHVALPLIEDEFRRLCEEQLWTYRDEDGDFVLADKVPNLDFVVEGIRAIEAIQCGLVERQSMSQPVKIEGSPILISEISEDLAYLAFRRYAYAEEVVAQRVLASAKSVEQLESVTSDEVLDSLKNSILNSEGRLAVKQAIERNLSILTGGPGRGKTTVIASLLFGLRLVGEAKNTKFSVALCAPTAKAAVRMEEAIKGELATAGETWDDLQTFVNIDERSGSVHRLLGIRPDNTKSLRNLDHDFVIIDEVSMLDISLLAKVIEHSPRAHLVLVGDPDQLTSVNVGAALRDIVDGVRSAPLPGLVSELVTNYRSIKEIDDLATAINEGDLPKATKIIQEHPGTLRWETTYGSEVAANLAWATELKNTALAYSESKEKSMEPLGEVLNSRAILCATHVGEGSVYWWRDTISRLMEAEGNSFGRMPVGMPVLVTANEQSVVLKNNERLSNGDVGVVVPGEGVNEILFGPVSSPRVRREAEIGASEPAWSMTIHKSQGSEYETVVVSLPNSNSRILTKELLYTAVTRARKKVVILGSHDALAKAISHRTFRASGLVERLASRAKA